MPQRRRRVRRQNPYGGRNMPQTMMKGMMGMGTLAVGGMAVGGTIGVIGSLLKPGP
jgi:hypothetical protein